MEERGCLEGNSITPGTALLAFRSDIWKLFDRSKCPNKYLYWQLYTCHPFANVQMIFELPFLLLFGMSWFFPHQSWSTHVPLGSFHLQKESLHLFDLVLPKVLSQKIVKPPSSEDRSRLCSLSHPPLRLRGCGRASGGGEGGGCSSLVLPVAGRAHTTQRLHSQCPSGTHPILTHPLWSEQWPLVTEPKKVKTLDFPWNLCCLVGCLVTWVSTAISSESSTDCQWWCLSPESCWRE